MVSGYIGYPMGLILKERFQKMRGKTHVMMEFKDVVAMSSYPMELAQPCG